jgi:hypothetical protein
MQRRWPGVPIARMTGRLGKQSLSVVCNALVSQAAGRNDEAEVQRLFNQAQSLSFFAGALFLAVAFGMMGTYAERLSGDPETALLARPFLVYFIPALRHRRARRGAPGHRRHEARPDCAARLGGSATRSVRSLPRRCARPNQAQQTLADFSAGQAWQRWRPGLRRV